MEDDRSSGVSAICVDLALACMQMQLAAYAVAGTLASVAEDEHWQVATDTLHGLADGPDPELALSVATLALAKLTMDRYQWLAFALSLDGDHLAEGQLEAAPQ